MLRLLVSLAIATAMFVGQAMAAESERPFGVDIPGATGDGNGFETGVTNASQILSAADGVAAFDNQSGTACGTLFTPACGCLSSVRDSHRFRAWGHAVNVSADADILGLGVRLRAKSNSSFSTPALYVRVSIDGGSTWSTCSVPLGLDEEYETYLIGGPTDLLGLSPTAADVRSATLFIVELTTAASSGARDFSLDILSTSVWHVVDTPTPTATPTGPTQTPVSTATATPTNTPTPLGNILTVNTIADCNDLVPGDGSCSCDTNPCGECSIYAAIQESNAFAGVQRIRIPAGEYRLDRADQDIDITANVIIEGLGTAPAGSVPLVTETVIELRGDHRRFATQLTGLVSISNIRIETARGLMNTPQFGACYSIPNGGEVLFIDVMFNRCINNRQPNIDIPSGNGSMGGAIFADNEAIVRGTRLQVLNANSNWGGGIAAIGDSKVHLSESTFDGNQVYGMKRAEYPCGDSGGGGSHVFIAGTGLSELIADRTTFKYAITNQGLGGGILNGDNQGSPLGPGSGPDDIGGPNVGIAGLVRLTNCTLNKNRGKRGRCGSIASFGGTVEIEQTTISKEQSKCSSALCFHLGAHFQATNSVLANWNTSGPDDDGPSEGFRMCWDDGTATYNLDNTMDDSNPGAHVYNGERPTPCPSAIPVGDACLPESTANYGGPTETALPITNGCVSTQTGDVLGLTDGISPLVDMADSPFGVVDQRGLDRNVDYPGRLGPGVDIGSVEVQASE